nr:UDP-3-O-acyl-N-acetylglucosamine deacetylase [Cognatishimia sp. MH4019]
MHQRKNVVCRLEANVQKTLKTSVTFEGVGLHSGEPVRATVHPASAHHGIWFKRTDVTGADPFVPAKWNAVEQISLCTLIRNGDGVSVSTLEHIMAALVGCGIHNALVELNGPELPILDGSAAVFVQRFLAAGLQAQDEPVAAIRVLRRVEVTDGLASARLDPADHLIMDFRIDFEDAAIGEQTKTLSLSNGTFVRELCDSRTFCRHSDIEFMHANGMALGGTLDNAVVVDGDAVLSPGGFRYKDEAVRHKMLDALGDLGLAGAPLMARYTGNRAGHALTNKLLHALFADPTAYIVEQCTDRESRILPGVGVRKADLPAIA